MADAALDAEQLDRRQHVVEVVCRLAHAHEDDLAHRAPHARQHHLRDDFGAAELAQQPALAGLAEHATDGAAELCRDAHAVARQQHAFHRLAVGEFDQQARRAVGAGVSGAQPRERFQFGEQGRQGRARFERQEVFGPAFAAALRQRVRPQAQHAVLVAWFGAMSAQALAQGVDLHGGRGRGVDERERGCLRV